MPLTLQLHSLRSAPDQVPGDRAYLGCRCGPVDFKVPQSEANQPRNILEEIVW